MQQGSPFGGQRGTKGTAARALRHSQPRQAARTGTRGQDTSSKPTPAGQWWRRKNTSEATRVKANGAAIAGRENPKILPVQEVQRGLISPGERFPSPMSPELPWQQADPKQSP